MTVVDDGRCFACGPESEIGLHLRFERVGDGAVRAETTLAPAFQGWVGIAHGGIAMTLLDEAMAHAVGAAGVRGMSASMQVRFRRPLPLDEPLTIEGRVKWQRRGVLGVDASVLDRDGNLLVSGEGRFVSRGTVEPGRLGLGDG